MSDHFDHTLERKLESKPDEAGDGVVNVRRIEVITGTERRRKWPAAEKARILIDSLEPGANVSEVARRNGINPQQLFGWRREARALFEESAGESATRLAGQPMIAPTSRVAKTQPPAETMDVAPAFASVVIAASSRPPPSPPSTSGSGVIEITVGDVVLRVVGKVEVELLAMVLRAVRRAS